MFLEQYVTKLNIESETAASIARTLLLPAAIRYKAELLTAEEPEMASELGELITSFVDEIKALENANLKENHPEDYGILSHAKYMHDTVFPAMGAVREVADRLEKVVADDLWPLPKYSRDPLHQVAAGPSPLDAGLGPRSLLRDDAGHRGLGGSRGSREWSRVRVQGLRDDGDRRFDGDRPVGLTADGRHDKPRRGMCSAGAGTA